MRVAATHFGAWPLVFVRVALAALVLLPLLLWQGQGAALCRHWRPIAVVGLLNSALPFALFTYAALAIGAGLSAIFNATTALWTALIAWVWLHDRPAPLRALGLALAVLCSGVACVLTIRLIARIGPSGAAIETFLIPPFAVGWGWAFLGEAPTWGMAAGGAVILFGTAIATGVFAPRWIART